MAAVAATVSGASPAGASSILFVGYAGGSQVRAANNTITSDLTAASNMNVWGHADLKDSAKAAGVSVPNLVSADGVTTSTESRTISGGFELISHAKTAGVRLLGGAITLDAVDTTATARIVNNKVSSDTRTTFVGLKIAGRRMPVSVRKNFNLTIPGIAKVVLNQSFTSTSGSQVMTIGTGLYLSLLKPRGNNAFGAEVFLNPTYAALGTASPDSDHGLGGKAYATRVTADAGKLAHVQSDPTVPVAVAGDGTHGKTVTSSVAGVNLSTALKVGAIKTTAVGTNGTTRQNVETTAQAAGINLLNGLITADVVKSDAHISGPTGGPYTVTATSNLAHLRIAGKAIPIGVKPNTVIKVAKLATVTINEQTKSTHSVTVRALVIELSTAAYGLPVGARVEVASASVSAV